MKHGKKPTREQRKVLQKWKLDPSEWFVVKDKPDELLIVHRADNTTRTIFKEK